MMGDVDRRQFTGFEIDQCPRCGSKNVQQETCLKTGGGPHEINDHVSRLECGDCGWTGDAR